MHSPITVAESVGYEIFEQWNLISTSEARQRPINQEYHTIRRVK